MKKITTFILCFACVMLLLSGCKQPPADNPDTNTTGQTEPSTNKTEPTTGETAGNTEYSKTVENKAPAAELNTAEDVEKFIKENKWYLRALGCVFEKPEDIPARLYFYLGVGADTQAT